MKANHSSVGANACPLLFSALLALVSLFSFSSLAFAQEAVPASRLEELEQQESENLEEDTPLDIDDATPVESGSVQVDFFSHYERNAGKGTFELTPQFEVGFGRDWQADVSVPFRFGEDDRGSGDIGVGLLRRLTKEQANRPSIAVAARAVVPTGRDSRGVDTTLRFLIHKRFGANLNNRLLFNAIYTHNAKAAAEERENLLRFVAGYSRTLSERATFLLDVVHEQEEEKGEVANLLEAGVRRSLKRGSVLGLGIGAGLNHEAPNYLVRASFEKSF